MYFEFVHAEWPFHHVRSPFALLICLLHHIFFRNVLSQILAASVCAAGALENPWKKVNFSARKMEHPSARWWLTCASALAQLCILCNYCMETSAFKQSAHLQHTFRNWLFCVVLVLLGFEVPTAWVLSRWSVHVNCIIYDVIVVFWCSYHWTLLFKCHPFCITIDYVGVPHIVLEACFCSCFFS